MHVRVCVRADVAPFDVVPPAVLSSGTLPDKLVESFEQETGYTLEVLKSGDGGELTNKLVLTKEGGFQVPMDDDIVAACLVARDGQVTRA